MKREPYRLIYEPTGKEYRASLEREGGAARSLPRRWDYNTYRRYAKLLARHWEENSRNKFHARQSSLAYGIESAYCFGNRRTIFVESVSLVEMIMSANMDIKLADLSPPLGMNVFSICWPPGLLIHGQRISPLLVYINLDDTTGDTMFAFVTRRGYLGHAACGVRTEKELAAILSGAELDVNEKFEDDEDFMGIDLEKSLWRMSVATIRLIIYMIAEGSHVRDGFPKDMTVRDRRHSKNSGVRNVQSIGTPANSSGSKMTHWRNWHFRSLRSNRYKRDSNGNVRIIFVKGAVIGSGDVKTVD